MHGDLNEIVDQLMAGRAARRHHLIYCKRCQSSFELYRITERALRSMIDRLGEINRETDPDSFAVKWERCELMIETHLQYYDRIEACRLHCQQN